MVNNVQRRAIENDTGNTRTGVELNSRVAHPTSNRAASDFRLRTDSPAAWAVEPVRPDRTESRLVPRQKANLKAHRRRANHQTGRQESGTGFAAAARLPDCPEDYSPGQVPDPADWRLQRSPIRRTSGACCRS